MPMPPEGRGLEIAIAIVRATALLALLATLLPIQAVIMVITRGPVSFSLPPLIHRAMCRILGIRVEFRGSPVIGPRVIWMSNHLSYLDIPVLGRRLHASFVSKDDVRGWPLFGRMARLQQTVFISRERRQVAQARRQIHAALTLGRSLILFPEGTSSDGRCVLRFRSGLLPDADAGAHAWVQPVAIELLSADGTTETSQSARDRYAYYGTMHLVSHLWRFLRGPGARVRVSFLAPAQLVPGLSRKMLAAHAWEQVSAHVATKNKEVVPQ